MGANQGMMQGQGQGRHQGRGAQAMPADPASRGYMESMRTMNRNMRKPMTGNADQDFARMMVAHHQGAVDMARVEIEHGTDPDLKAMAQKVVDDQTKEIQQFQDWLKQHPGKAARK
ncbi:CopM family metallochaperone [Azospirillum sp. sgz301742]